MPFSKKIITLVLAVLLTMALQLKSVSQNYVSFSSSPDTHSKIISIKSIYGKLYAYIVLLFNENPHFVNLIIKDSIPLKTMANEGFHIKEYKNYLKTIQNYKFYPIAQTMLALYSEPEKFDQKTIDEIEKKLTSLYIILKFSKDADNIDEKISLDYCIFGKKILLSVKHPFFKINEKIYNILPFIYYDEFSTSNSTFYFDMIYINPVEVDNDYLITKKLINGERVNSLFFVGSPVSDDIKFCLKRAFENKKLIKNDIWEMFVIHEVTHKILNNRYNNFDQVTGETLSLHSTIYTNSFLGLAVLYSYLNYNRINPHRIAAMKYINFIAEKTGNSEITNNPGLIKMIPQDTLKNLTKEHFDIIIQGH